MTEISEVLSNWKRERFIRKVLKRLASQRVAMILPGNILVVEKAVQSTNGVEEALRTCYLRGWVEPIHNSIPHGDLTSEGELPEGALFSRKQTVYRLTEAGWNIIHNTYQLVLYTFIVALIGLTLAVAEILLRMGPPYLRILSLFCDPNQ